VASLPFLVPPTAVSGSVTFYFSVVGSKSEPVPLIFTASGIPLYSDPARPEQFVSVEVQDPGGDFQACVAGGFDVCDPNLPNGIPNSFSFSNTFNALPNDVYGVTVSGGGDLSCPCSVWSVNANFGVTIDPSFADASDFNLEFGAASNVPEPGSILMLGTGLLALVGLNPKKFTT
jgi:hypothetical protein